MAGNMIKITDYDKVTPTKDDVLLINQNGSNRKTTVNDLVGDIGTLGGKKLVEKVNDNTTQLNALTQKTDSIRHKGAVVVNANPLANDVIIVGTSLINNQQDIEVTFNKETSAPIQLGILYFV